jgi:hypothetical protein
MRNLKQYPITADEVIEAVQHSIYKELNVPPEEYPVGSTTGICLTHVVQFLVENRNKLEEYLKNKS